MKPKQYILAFAMFVVAIMAAVRSAPAKQTTSTPGAPNATTTIEGNYLPPAPPRFGGDISLDAKDSKPYWPPRVVPPKGAANVLLIMTDDQGYGVSSTFGGVIPTPALDRVAKAGLRILLRLYGRRDRPVEAVAFPRSHPDFSVGRAPRRLA